MFLAVGLYAPPLFYLIDMKIVNLFGEEIEEIKPVKKGKAEIFNNYDAFVEKFKPKKTTDDCYTPPGVYNIVLDYVREKVDLTGCRIVRPFYPGGDYENEEYKDSDVVIDNPPFSIITRIVRFYMEQNIRFFLFAPYLTIFQPAIYALPLYVRYR